MPNDRVLVLRTCNADMTSYGGFQWPTSGHVSAPDWSPEPECGHGLHGFLWGEGDGYLVNHKDNSRWLVLEVDKKSIIELDCKVKFPAAEVIFVGDQSTAAAYIADNGGRGRAIIGLRVKVEGNGVATSGDYGFSQSGDVGTSVSGNFGTSVSGERGHSTSGYGGSSFTLNEGVSVSKFDGLSKSGYEGFSKSGDYGLSISGKRGISQSGQQGASIAGDWGTSISGHEGYSSSGKWGVSITGVCGKCASGPNGRIQISYFDEFRSRFKIGYVGENGILPDVPYRLDKNNDFVITEA